jgi:hypothetical protein
MNGDCMEGIILLNVHHLHYLTQNFRACIKSLIAPITTMPKCTTKKQSARRGRFSTRQPQTHAEKATTSQIETIPVKKPYLFFFFFFPIFVRLLIREIVERGGIGKD